ncbi:MAG: hydroxyisourate hydrolase [Pseudonocardia sp.]
MISTHVLDAALGCPAADVPVTLTTPDGVEHTAVTDADGRVATLVARVVPGRHVLRFDTATYFAATGQEGFHPEVLIVFQARADRAHYHVPLLLAPYAYSTYRGS